MQANVAIKKDDTEDEPLDHRLAERCLFYTCIKCGTKTHFLLSEVNLNGKGRGLVTAIVSQMAGGVYERMSRTIFAE